MSFNFKGPKFGFGPKELGGSVDLLNHYRLRPHHEFFCKKSLPVSVSETHYLQNVVGDREIRKGDGMELDPLSKNVTLLEEKKGRVHPFRLDVLADVFHMQETATLRLSSPNRGTPATMTKLKSKSKDTHHKKSKDRNKRKAKDKKDHSHQSKGIDDNRAKDKERDGQPLDGQEHLISQEKKRRCNGNEYPPRAQRLQQMSVS